MHGGNLDEVLQHRLPRDVLDAPAIVLTRRERFNASMLSNSPAAIGGLISSTRSSILSRSNMKALGC